MAKLVPGFRPGQPGASGGLNYMKDLQKVMANLNIQINNIKDGGLKGLIKSAIEIRQRTEKSYPLTPVDLGNLRSSWFVVTAKGKAGNDKWNKPFRNAKRGSATKRSTDFAGKLQADHISAIAEKTGEAKAAQSMDQILCVMGYSANYAGYVHEWIDNPNYTRPGSGRKWFEQALKESSGKILQIIVENARIK
jgi:hypothetical protein